MRLHLHVQLDGRPVLVVGAGAAGAEKVERLVAAGAQVTVVDPAPVVHRLQGVHAAHQRDFHPDDVHGQWLVIAATGSPTVNDDVAAAASSMGIWVNRADKADGGDLAFGAVVRRGRVEVGVSTGGTSPSLARWVRDQIDAALPAELEAVAELLATRPRVAGARRHAAVPIDQALDALRRGDVAAAHQLINGA